MTNAQIILLESIRLMEDGVLAATDEVMVVDVPDADGNLIKKELAVPEPIHTYNGWLERGYQVRKGEKACCQFSIWKHTSKKVEVGEEEQITERMIMKLSSFFKESQVDRKAE